MCWADLGHLAWETRIKEGSLVGQEMVWRDRSDFSKALEAGGPCGAGPTQVRMFSSQSRLQQLLHWKEPRSWPMLTVSLPFCISIQAGWTGQIGTLGFPWV